MGNISPDSQVYDPGGTVVASVTIKVGKPTIIVSCSYADPTGIEVDGAPAAPENVRSGTGFVYNWRGLAEQPIPAAPSYGVVITEAGSHVVRFRLDPRYAGKCFTHVPGNYGSWSGPMVVLSGPNWTSLDGFVIRPAASQLSVRNFTANPERIEPESTEPGKQTTTLAGEVVAQEVTNPRYQLTITNADGVLVRSYPLTAASVGTSAVSEVWDGTDASGEVAYGRHEVLLEATCDEGLMAMGTAQVLVSTPVPIIKQISSKIVTMVDESNQPIETPQYDRDQFRDEPMVVPIREKKPSMVVKIFCGAKKQSYLIWGADAAQRIVFSPKEVIFRKPGEQKVRFDIEPPLFISRTSVITWFFLDKTAEPQLMDATTSPIYWTLDKPEKPQTRPRTDVVEYAMRHAMLAFATDASSVRSALTEGIYFKSGFQWDETGRPHHTTADLFGRHMELTVSNFIDPDHPDYDPEGNCQDFSNLFQVSCAALGVPAEVRRLNGTLLNDNDEFFFYIQSVKPVGLNWTAPTGQLQFHQAGWFDGAFFDPTYQLDIQNPTLPLGMPEDTYRSLLVVPGTEPYAPQPPDRPIEVY